MSYFHVTASNIRLEGNELVANLDNGSGESPEARIDLNTVLGNEDGTLSIPFLLVSWPLACRVASRCFISITGMDSAGQRGTAQEATHPLEHLTDIPS